MPTPKTLSELYQMSYEAYPAPESGGLKQLFRNNSDAKYAKSQQANFRNLLYNSMSPSEKDALYYAHMMDLDSDEYEGFVGNGWTPEQYEYYVKNNPQARLLFEERYGLAP